MIGRAQLPAMMVLATACSSAEESLTVRFPETERATSAILGVSAGNVLSLTAHTLDGEPRIGPTSPITGPARLDLLLFDETLDQLGLDDGPITMAPGGVEIPPARNSFALEYDGDTTGDWSSGPPSAEMTAARIVRDPASLCPRFSVKQQFEIGATMDNAFAFSLADDAVLIGTLDATFNVIEPTGVRAVTDVPADLPLGVAKRLPSGDVWFGGVLGQVWRGSIDPLPNVAIHAAPVTTSSSAQQILWMIVHEDPELEIFTLGIEGAFERYHDGQWERLHDFGGMQTKGGLVEVEPGVIYAATGNRPQVMRWKDGLVVDITPRDLTDGITGMDSIPGVGVLMSAGQGELYLEATRGTWQRLGGATIGLFVYTFVPYADGVLLGGALGYLAHYRSETDSFCPEEQIGAGAIRKIIPFAGGLLLAEDVPISRQRAIVSWLERR